MSGKVEISGRLPVCSTRQKHNSGSTRDLNASDGLKLLNAEWIGEHFALPPPEKFKRKGQSSVLKYELTNKSVSIPDNLTDSYIMEETLENAILLKLMEPPLIDFEDYPFDRNPFVLNKC